MKIKIEYHKTECGGMGCTPNGCYGHSTGVPCAIVINGFRLTNNEIENFEPLAENPEESDAAWRRWIDTIQWLKAAVHCYNMETGADMGFE